RSDRDWSSDVCSSDLDGVVDLILANGHPDDMIDQYSQQVHYKEPLLLFHQEGGKLRNVSADAGPAFTRMYPARGLAVGDLDNDEIGRASCRERVQIES